MKDIINNIIKKLTPAITEKEDHIKESGENFSSVEEYGRLLLLKFFNDLGLFTQPDQKVKRDEIKNKLSLIEKYEKLLDILLLILQKEEFIEIQKDSIVTTSKIEQDVINDKLNDIDNLKDNLIKAFSDMKPHFDLLDQCLSNYENILSGKKDASEVMFPMFSIDLVKDIFAGNRMADYFNQLIADSIKHYVELKKDSPDQKIKILEIGAGTGGTSISILNGLKENKDIVEFYFTDISKVFVKKMQKILGPEHEFAFFKKLNIENDLIEQGFDLGSFDIVCASNVVHATKNINNTMKNIHSLLKMNGIILLNEVTNSQDFVNLTFGLMDGWWKFEDEEIRLPNTPLLNVGSWKNVLKSNGFINVELVSSSHQEKDDSFSQSLLIGQKA